MCPTSQRARSGRSRRIGRVHLEQVWLGRGRAFLYPADAEDWWSTMRIEDSLGPWSTWLGERGPARPPGLSFDRLRDATRELPGRLRRPRFGRSPDGGGPALRPRDLRERLGTARARGTEWSLPLQRTTAGQRLRRVVFGSSLDSLERAILRALISGPEHAGKGGDFHVPFEVRDLRAALGRRYTDQAVEAAILRLTERGLVLHPGEELYLTAAGPVALRSEGPLRGRGPSWRRSVWVIADAGERSAARQALSRAREPLAELQALDPPPKQRKMIDEAIDKIDRLSSGLT